MKENTKLQDLKKRLDQALKGFYLIIHNFANRKERRNKAPLSRETTNKNLINNRRQQIKEDRQNRATANKLKAKTRREKEKKHL